ncbi:MULTISPECIES: DUF3015 family protein [unclassified Arsukibacterium]|uniref:DUF3015 family protein n=1 Tax=unclassified Arsukibacterium TaxID=2635278 RepID=UPI000C5AD90C|nr:MULTISPECIES: DUF3015 family protein [unclassified Arsukibacterium]MAA94563.1 hypothetical protein [Rheinheimera sp.]MBM32854.1 hypothetical protein [Rheinheimera sp.]HAW91537.1 hypothetical protein [Candidatus Azambacteria bacterium]|tara:strand:+ start:333 stop:815 length:483 start_codon:yes stop_codon:yes gene_type:complete
MKYSAIAALTVSMVLSVSAYADKAVGSGPNPFSDCGIGAALFPEHKVLAVTSNVIWDIGTTAVTSATASPETCSGKNVDAAAFILNSYDSIIEDTARGEGEHLAALMNILEVAPAKQAQVIDDVRNQMSLHIADESYNAADKREKSQQYYFTVISAVTSA